MHLKSLALAAAVALSLGASAPAHALTFSTSFESIGVDFFPMNTTYSNGGLDVRYTGASFDPASSLNTIDTIDGAHTGLRSWEPYAGGVGLTQVRRTDGGGMATFSGFFNSITSAPDPEFMTFIWFSGHTQVGMKTDPTAIPTGNSGWQKLTTTCPVAFCDGLEMYNLINPHVFDAPVDVMHGDDFLVTGTVHGVPEPATWALMLTGFFGLGAMLRRRRSLALA